MSKESEDILIRVSLKFKEDLMELKNKIKSKNGKSVSTNKLTDKIRRHKYWNIIREDIYYDETDEE